MSGQEHTLFYKPQLSTDFVENLGVKDKASLEEKGGSLSRVILQDFVSRFLHKKVKLV